MEFGYRSPLKEGSDLPKLNMTEALPQLDSREWIADTARAAIIAILMAAGCTFNISLAPSVQPASEPPVIAQKAPEKVDAKAVSEHFFNNILPMVLEQNVPVEEKVVIEFPFEGKKYTATFLIHIDKEKKEIKVPVQIKDEKGEVLFQEVLSLPLPPDENSMVEK